MAERDAKWCVLKSMNLVRVSAGFRGDCYSVKVALLLPRSVSTVLFQRLLIHVLRVRRM